MPHTLSPLLALVFLVSAAAGSTLRLTLLSNTSTMGAVCLDGSPAGYYFAPGAGSGVNSWLIFFQGGGWCYSEVDCWGRSKTSLGSSKSWGPTTSVDGIVSDNCSTNPTFCTWNRVYINYCDGNSFSGNRDAPVVVRGDPIYFRGHRILLAILQDLHESHALGGATEVLLGGRSAGGLATFLHADLVGEVIAGLAPGLQKYGAAPVSGFFLDHVTVEGKHVYPEQMRAIFLLANATGGVHPDCIRSYPVEDQWHCNFALPTYAHTKSRVFVLNSALDAWQTQCVLTSEPVTNASSTANGNCSAAPGWRTCATDVEKCDAAEMEDMIAYERDFLTAIQSVPSFGRAGNGAFLHSCHTHSAAASAMWNTIRISDVSMQEAVARWWQGSASAPAASNTYLPCMYRGGDTHPRQCNPTCPLTSDGVTW